MSSKRGRSYSDNQQRTDNGDDDGDNSGERHQRKNPKLPPAMALLLQDPLLVNSIEECAKDLDFIKIYDNARRFHKNIPDKEVVSAANEEESSVEEPASLDDETDRYHVVELYFDDPPPNCLESELRIVKFEQSRLLDGDEPAPVRVVETSRPTNVRNVADGIASDLITQQGYVEVEEFLEFHKVHLPCFTWILEKDGNHMESQEILSSRVGGFPAMYPGEAWPTCDGEWSEELRFAFQINLANVPPRMRCITGSSGLLQLWLDTDVSGFARVVPAEDFGKLDIRSQIPLVEKPKAARAITGWVERADYNFPKIISDDVSINSLEPTNQDLASDLSGVDRFGGYGDQEYARYTPCECGKSHLERWNTFNLANSSVLLDVQEGYFGSVTYCPCDVKKFTFAAILTPAFIDIGTSSFARQTHPWTANLLKTREG